MGEGGSPGSRLGETAEEGERLCYHMAYWRFITFLFSSFVFFFSFTYYLFIALFTKVQIDVAVFLDVSIDRVMISEYFSRWIILRQIFATKLLRLKIERV